MLEVISQVCDWPDIDHVTIQKTLYLLRCVHTHYWALLSFIWAYKYDRLSSVPALDSKGQLLFRLYHSNTVSGLLGFWVGKVVVVEAGYAQNQLHRVLTDSV